MSSPSNLMLLRHDELASCRGGISSTALFRASGAANIKLGEAREYHRANSLASDLSKRFGLPSMEPETRFLTEAVDRIAKFSAQAERFLAAAKQKLLSESK